MWAHPGKKLLFMGGEFAQEREWSHERSLDWHLLALDGHRGVQTLVQELNGLLRSEPALYEHDFDSRGFEWIDANDVDGNVFSFIRTGATGRPVVCIANLAPVPRHGYRVGVPAAGEWAELLNTDEHRFGGSGVVNGKATARNETWHGRPASLTVTLPPLGVTWLAPT
jgi:1,4-alpha-glucan branching enzyme